MATYLELVNKVLVKLREDSVSSVTQNEYSSLIGSLVNEAKRDVENSHRWSVLRSTDTISVTSSVSSYDYTNLKDNSILLSVYDNTQKLFLEQVDLRLARYNSSVSGPPQGWYLKGNSSGVPTINIYPTPNGSYTVYVDIYTPQDELTLGSTSIIIPWFPVYMGAYWKALMERGDDGGETANLAYMEYSKALGDSINNDAIKLINEFTWYVS